MPLTLLGLKGSLTGHSFNLSDQPVVIGRNPNNDIDLVDIQVSRHHCRILPHQSGFLLEDMASANGTSLNGQRLPREAVPLYAGDVIEIGRSKFIVIVTD